MCSQETEDEHSLIDNWEDFDDNPALLDEQLRKMNIKPSKTMKNASDTSNIRLLDGDNYTQYPHNPVNKIMILKRPSDCSQNDNHLQKLPQKTLEQRQTEYAEARLRILGHSGSPVEKSKAENLPGLPTSDGARAGEVFVGIGNMETNRKPIAVVKPTPVNSRAHNKKSTSNKPSSGRL